MKNPIALVTGATSGFGQAIALRLAEGGYRLIITGRRSDRLHALSSHLTSMGCDNQLSCFDIRDREATTHAWNDLPESWKEVDVLVNNAGLAAGREPVELADPDDWDQMIDTNIRGILNISRLVIPGMKDRKRGTIIHIGSIAGREGYPGGNVYSATKFAVEALTRSMRIDLLPFGIRVGQLAPGAADTEFSTVRFKGDQARAAAVYQGFEPLHAADIAEVLWFMVSRPPHVCIQDILVMPTAQAGAAWIHRTSE
ncbi:MAG: SDR family NAD(P)-dependent oxidoreductase [Flavobacteriales bacterium]